MFRDLIPELADHYHVVAPIYPALGFKSPVAAGLTFELAIQHFQRSAQAPA
jgi:hypothetical protein